MKLSWQIQTWKGIFQQVSEQISNSVSPKPNFWKHSNLLVECTKEEKEMRMESITLPQEKEAGFIV